MWMSFQKQKSLQRSCVLASFSNCCFKIRLFYSKYASTKQLDCLLVKGRNVHQPKWHNSCAWSSLVCVTNACGSNGSRSKPSSKDWK
jgi:hypothetical protein